MSNLVKGTFILTLATVISKILGFVYVVPFTALVGTQGYILFEYAYKPYVIILSFATMGVPLAVSKFISKYNELGDFKTGHKLFKSGLVLLTITGALFCFLLYYFAPNIASLVVSETDTTGNNIEDVIFVIRMMSFALIIVPPMAVARGFFQGHQSMAPTAFSQVIEQLVRIIVILLGAFLIIEIFNKTTSFAVGIATLAASIGAIGGSIVLFYYWFKRKKSLENQIKESKSNMNKNFISIYKELISYAIPFVIVGLAIPVYQTIDTFTINYALMNANATQLEAETTNSIVALVQKIILIPVSLATAFGLTLVPGITKSFVNSDNKTLHYQIKKSFQIILFLTLPCIVGLMLLSTPAFASLFGVTHSTEGGRLMLWYAPTALLFSYFIVTSAILQGLDKHKLAVISLIIGVIIKFSLNIPFVSEFGGIGSVFSTNLGFIVSILINLIAIKKYATFNFSTLNKQNRLILLSILSMSIFVLIFDKITVFTLHRFSINGYLFEVTRLIIGGIIGGVCYFYVSFKSNLIKEILGENINNYFTLFPKPRKTFYSILITLKLKKRK